MEALFNLIDKEKLKAYMDNKRFVHTVGVAETAAGLAVIHSTDREKTVIAALLHDCARGMPVEQLLALAEKFNLPVDSLENLVPELLHGKVGAEIAKTDFFIDDEEILNAIRRHTLGSDKMTLLDKVIFVSDMIEPNRRFPGVETLRKLASENLDEAFLAGLNSTILYVISRDGIIHPASIEARNSILLAKDLFIKAKK